MVFLPRSNNNEKRKSVRKKTEWSKVTPSPYNGRRAQQLVDKMDERYMETKQNQNRQAKVWNMIASMDSFKTPPLYSTSGARPTLTSFHIMVQPTWWQDQNKNNPALTMDINAIDEMMAQCVQYYSDMSWGKMSLTYEVLEQKKISMTSEEPKLYGAKDKCVDRVTSQGYTEGVDYDGIIFIHHTAKSGVFASNGGKGIVNGGFIWVDYTQIDYKVLRHEIGHNFGHDHHGRNVYEYRNTRPYFPSTADGFDMMAGGNKYAISDFSVASKWFYNWLEDSSIVHMQPEGPTIECPTCRSSGTFVLKPFDRRNNPSSNENMGIHIPITTVYDTYYSTNYVYSYWISYRSGVDGDASNGITIHLAWFELYDSLFGAYFDSMIYDAFGDTSSKLDSFVVDGTCYHISPPAYLKDLDFVSAESLHPVVCVDDITPGSKATVSISFLDKGNPPPLQVDLKEKSPITCSSSLNAPTRQSMNSAQYNLLHVSNTGSDGLVTLSLEGSDEGGKSAYFYDEFPYSVVNFGSDPGYGSFKSVSTSDSNISYQSDHDNTWILIPPGGVTAATVTCQVNNCLPNQYMTNGNCVQCPLNSVSNYGSTSIVDCTLCPAGTGLLHPKSSQCTLSEDYKQITRSRRWRVWAQSVHTKKSWGWAVTRLQLFSDLSCNSPINPDGTPIDSGNAGDGWGPENVFGLGNYDTWGGRVDTDDTFWIGMRFNAAKNVKCVQLVSGSNSVYEVRIQAYNASDKRWENAWIQKSLDTAAGAVNTISMTYALTQSPTKEPTISPTIEPTASPTKDPTASPTREPTVSPTAYPTKGPTSHPTNHPTKRPTVHPTKSPVAISSNDICLDSPQRMKIEKSDETITRDCGWVAHKASARCELTGVSKSCPLSCGKCARCKDASLRFKLVKDDGKTITRDCSWVSKKPNRCNIDGVEDTCRQTCGKC
mmetsp:Transcript_15971/g.19504  ORF Transcript_15971/g.19504 Transcript_15971/m.19504 type:complete len:936 (-) Transcript_15971:113-2920(-)